MVYAFIIYPIFSLIAAIAADRMALAKNRNRGLWMILSLFLPPFAILLYFLTKRPFQKKSRFDGDDEDLRGDFLR